MNAEPQLDVITIGRSSVDLYGEQVGGRLEDMSSFAKYLGGCPANIAAGTARLGLRSALLTRVGDDHMGRFIIEQLRREGVCTDAIVSDSSRLTALVILGIRDRDRFPLLFYREDCADMALCEEDVDADFVRSARAVLITGTHLSRPGVRAASLKAVRIAKDNGRKVILDGDYRPVLWGLTAPELGEQRFIADERVTSELQAVLPDCDLIVGTEEELHILGGTTDTYAAISGIRALTDAQIVFKRGERGCIVYAGGVPASLDDGIAHEGFPIDVFNVLGAGDAFMSGFLRGWLRDEALEECCRLANAAGALVVSRHGCAPASPSWAEIRYFLDNGSSERALRHDAKLEHLHWATTRADVRPRLSLLALDDCPLLAELTGARQPRIAEFLQLVLAAVSAHDGPDVGLILDAAAGREALERSADSPVWTGRVIEEDERTSAADMIREWPVRQTAVFRMSPDAGRASWRRELRQAFTACRNARHELVLELDAPPDDIFAAIDEISELGIHPDWWAFPAGPGAENWDRLAARVTELDRHRHGVLVNGRSLDPRSLEDARKAVAENPNVAGIIMGPAVYGDIARRWHEGGLDAPAAVAALRDSIAHFAVARESLVATG